MYTRFTKLLPQYFLQFTAFFIDISFLLQALLAPFLYLWSPAVALANTQPQVELEYHLTSHEFELNIEPVKSVAYTLQYETEQGITDGYQDHGPATVDSRYQSIHPTGTQSSTDVVSFAPVRGKIDLTAQTESGEFTFNRSFIIKEGNVSWEQPADSSWQRIDDQTYQIPQVQVGVPYRAPQDSAVTVTFTHLPFTPGTLTIREITLSAEQQTELGALTPTAYDITSDMADGTFQYSLSLPNPQPDQEVQVKYSEDGQTFTEVTGEKHQEENVILPGLDHFTVFVVTATTSTDTVGPNTITVTPNSGNWWYWTDATATVEFITGPATAPSGTGSVNLQTTNVGSKAYIGTTAFNDQKLKEIKTFSYDTYITQRTGNVSPYLNIYFTSHSGDFYRMDYEPADNGGASLNTWQTWNVLGSSQWMVHKRTGSSWINQGLKSWDTVAKANSGEYKNATISDLWTTGLIINAGDSSTTAYSNFNGYVDTLVLEKDNSSTVDTYDFEPIVVVDSTAPAVPTILSPIHGSLLTGTDLTLIDWSDVTDPSGVSYQYESYGNATYTALRYQSGWLTASQIAASGTPDGNYYLRVRAQDGEGNTSAWSNSADNPHLITIDSTGPVAPTITFPVNNQAFRTSPILNDWTDVNDSNDVDFYQIEYIYDDGHTFSGAPYRTTTVSQRQHSPAVSEEGGVKIRVRAFDEAGNPGAWSNQIHYFYDLTAPVSTWTSQLDGTHWNSAIHLTGESTDGVGVAKVRLSARPAGNADAPWETFVTIENTAQSAPFSWSYDWTPSVDGDYDLKAAAEDTAGNQEASAYAYNIHFDTTAPDAPVLLTPDDGFATKGITFNQTWSGISDAVLYEYQSCFDSACITPKWSATYTGTTKVTGAGQPNSHFWWHVRAKDTANNWSGWSNVRELIIDNSAPAITLNTYAAPAITGYTNDVTPTFTGQTDDVYDAGIAKIEYRVLDATSTEVQGWTEASFVSGNSGDDIIPYTFTPNAVSEGTYTFEVHAYDRAGNVSTVVTQDLIVDTAGPIVTVSQPGQNELVRGTVNILGTISDPHHWRYYFAIDKVGGGSAVSGITTYSDDSEIDFSYNWDTTTVADGNYIIKLESRDKANNKTTQSLKWVTVTVDNTPPTAPVVEFPAADQAFNTTPILNDWSDADDVNGIQQYRVEYDYDDGHHFTDEPYRFTPTSQRNHAPELWEEGGVSFRVQAIDTIGNEGPWSEWRHYFYDVTLPSSTITSPAESTGSATLVTNEWDGSIAGTATDSLSGIEHVELVIHNQTNNVYWNGLSWVSGEQSVNATGTTAWSYSLPAPEEGTYVIASHAVDRAGNMENTALLTIVYDKTIPQVQITLDPVNPDGSNGWYKTRPTITLTATDDQDPTYGTKQIEYQWESATGSWTTYSGSFQIPGEGAYVLYYRALDKAGNYSDTGVKNVKWDSTQLSEGPLEVKVSPNPTSGTTAKVEWKKASDNLGIEHYEVIWKLKGTSIQHGKSVSSTTFETTIDQLEEGTWDVIVRAFDGVGNFKESGVDLIVDRTAPAIPVLNLTGTGVGTASLAWNAVEGANTYIVYYGTVSGDYIYAARVGNITAYTVQGLAAGSYFFVVRAVDAADNQSGNSNEVSTGSITGAPGATGGPATGFQPAGEVQGVSTDENITFEENSSETVETSVLDRLGEVLGKECNQSAWWYILGSFLLILIVLHLFLNQKLRWIAQLLLVSGAGYALVTTLCFPWAWLGGIGIITLFVEGIRFLAETPQSDPFTVRKVPRSRKK